ncbi:MAG TPA: tetratricopeptide repeat protein, partial [Candidatus Norongarragalinales archaeon]|nr:tetratricopeptide repeat protein [Candidatus Norongarragalinales archaeon]
MVRINGRGFSISRELPPAYAKVHSEVVRLAGRQIRELKLLSEKPSLTREDSERIPVLLQTIGKLVFTKVEEETKKVNPEIPRVSRGPLTIFFVPHPLEAHADFERQFFHPPTERAGLFGTINAHCAANAIAQTVLFQELGVDKIGALVLPGHIAPSLKIAGTTYVLDQNLFRRPDVSKALTLREYLRELVKAHANSVHPLHSVARNFFPKERPSVGDFVGLVRFQSGANVSISAAHSNMGAYFMSVGETRLALAQYRKALDADPGNT